MARPAREAFAIGLDLPFSWSGASATITYRRGWFDEDPPGASVDLHSGQDHGGQRLTDSLPPRNRVQSPPTEMRPIESPLSAQT